MEAAGQPVSPERVAELVPHARTYRPGSWLWRAAVSLVARGEDPTPEAVEQLRQTRRARAVARREARERADRVTERDRLRMIAYVRRYRRTHGVGPTWREVVSHMGWYQRREDRPFAEYVVGDLIEAGRLTDSGRPRSLDVAS